MAYIHTYVHAYTCLYIPIHTYTYLYMPIPTNLRRYIHTTPNPPIYIYIYINNPPFSGSRFVVVLLPYHRQGAKRNLSTPHPVWSHPSGTWSTGLMSGLDRGWTWKRQERRQPFYEAKCGIQSWYNGQPLPGDWGNPCPTIYRGCHLWALNMLNPRYFWIPGEMGQKNTLRR